MRAIRTVAKSLKGFCFSLMFDPAKNYFGVGCTLGLIATLGITNVVYVCPNLYGWTNCHIHIVLTLILAVLVFGNWLLFRRGMKANSKATYPVIAEWVDECLQSHSGKDLIKYCDICDEILPYRSDHCPLCKKCVLKRDHHCFLTGACVGLGNQRYFIVFLWWALIGASYATVMIATYIRGSFEPLSPWGWLNFVPPVAPAKWIVHRSFPGDVVLLTILFYGGVGGAGAAFAFLTTQCYFIAIGKTMYEHSRGLVLNDGLSFRQRLSGVFGLWWLLNFIVPLPYPSSVFRSALFLRPLRRDDVAAERDVEAGNARLSDSSSSLEEEFEIIPDTQELGELTVTSSGV